MKVDSPEDIYASRSPTTNMGYAERGDFVDTGNMLKTHKIIV